MTGKSGFVIRGGGGWFYDRPDGNTVFTNPANPPMATTQNLQTGLLQSLGAGGGISPLPVASLNTIQYNAKVPSTVNWQIGVQKSLPFQMVLDVSYVGDHAYNRFAGYAGRKYTGYQPGAPRHGLSGAVSGPDARRPTVPGAEAYTTNLLRPYQGLGSISQNTTAFWNTYHSIQVSVNRRFNHGFSIGANYTYGISLTGNTGSVSTTRTATGVPVLWSGEAAYEKLFNNLDAVPNFLKVNSTWNIPGITSKGAFLHVITGDWQVSGVLTAQSGGAYAAGFSYQTNGSQREPNRFSGLWRQGGC